MKLNAIFPLIFLLIITSSCTKKAPLIADWDAYINAYEDWQGSRLERLKSERGWLNLAGLYWIHEGENTFGSDSSNALIFPKNFPPYAGRILLNDSIVILEADPETRISVNDSVVTKMELQNDTQTDPTVMEHGSFRWFIIKRGEKYGIRLRDLENPRLKELEHIPSYSFSKDYVVMADFVPYDTVRMLEVPTVIENFYESYAVPGELRFKLKGRSQKLLPFTSGKGFFLIVGDQTNGLETYGAGRFLYTDSISGNKVLLDFNRAYNPPCAFSPFATCPIPPLENILDIKIEAGEKAVHLK